MNDTIEKILNDLLKDRKKSKIIKSSGYVVDSRLLNYDFASLYPIFAGDFVEPPEMKANRIRKEREKKIRRIFRE